MATPANIYRNAIDLNRYSNGVARKMVVAYNDIIIQAVNDLRAIETLPNSYKAARLRSILAQLKASLSTWAGDSSVTASAELQGLVELQSKFVTDQLKKVLPAGAKNMVNTVEISPQFGRSVVFTDPTEINVVVLQDDIFDATYGSRQTFNLTTAKGVTITLPNGDTLNKSFRGIAESQAELFSQVVRNGVLTGEPTTEIAKRLIGRLDFGEAGTIASLASKGGQATAVADHQILTLLRTSINQVSNKAAMNIYEANRDVTEKYEYISTLDSRTTALCASLDSRIFEYGKGPMPPQHFNCRSTIVAVVDWEGLGFEPPEEGTRATKRNPRTGEPGQVPANMTYGEWLYQQPYSYQEEVLGRGRAKYFELLAKKDPAGRKGRDAIARFVRKDGQEVTLEELKRRYGAEPLK